LKGCHKVSLQPSLLQAEQPQLSQPVLNSTAGGLNSTFVLRSNLLECSLNCTSLKFLGNYKHSLTDFEHMLFTALVELCFLKSWIAHSLNTDQKKDVQDGLENVTHFNLPILPKYLQLS